MKKIHKITAPILAFLLVFALLLPFSLITKADTGNAYEGKIVILHSNDVHGAIDGYPVMKEFADEIESGGGEVILVDAGDFSQGNSYASFDKGESVIELMNMVGYDVVTVGNHEFDYGSNRMMEIINELSAETVSINILIDDIQVFDSSAIIELNGMKIGFIGVETPEALTKSNPSKNPGLSIVQGDELYSKINTEAEKLKASGASLVICITHLGVDVGSVPNRSEDLWANVQNVDFIIDAHSHTEMTKGENGEPIQSTGTKFANIGIIEIDKDTSKITNNYLYKITDESPIDLEVKEKVDEIKDKVNKEYKTVIGKTEVDLNGEKAPGNRTEETNMGDLIADSMVWYLTKKNTGSIEEGVPVVALENGGGIRNWIHKGDITKQNVFDVLPFGNTLSVVYVSGSELLEALEASTYCTPKAVGAFPQISGMNIVVNTYEEYDAGETYPGSTYRKPNSIKRIVIKDVNGQSFDLEGRYAVITNDFAAAGGDTFYAFKAASKQFDTGFSQDVILSEFIAEELDGVVGEEYQNPKGRITIVNEKPEPAPDPDPKPNPNPNPLTGDSETGFLWIVLMITSITVLSAVGFSKKQQ
ncbi:MAG: bifunctional metallophosphatase/5'-nucleotidase [Lachnospiraceae bacterium]|nr:bifunctional metallophosphatase/5'-nucleotidase [Lachnospiraceae bacterium]